jgi:hypothetical protein
LEWIKNGDGAFDRGQYDKPYAEKHGHVRQNVMHKNAPFDKLICFISLYWRKIEILETMKTILNVKNTTFIIGLHRFNNSVGIFSQIIPKKTYII